MKLDAALIGSGLKKSKLDPCIYFTGNSKLIIAIYVDDFLIFYEDENELENLKKFLKTTFKMKDLGPANSCLGIRINQQPGKIELDQIAYINEILDRFGMTDCKPIGTPTDTNVKLSKNDLLVRFRTRKQLAVYFIWRKRRVQILHLP